MDLSMTEHRDFELLTRAFLERYQLYSADIRSDTSMAKQTLAKYFSTQLKNNYP